MSVLIVVPTLNEASHVGSVLDDLLPFAERVDGLIVVADGGSADATRAIVSARAAASSRIRLLINPGRLQAAGVNLAVERFGDGAEWLLRVDAHSRYPSDYGDVLLAEARRQEADSVVVAMTAVGAPGVHSAIANAQNAPLGNGGSAHRLKGGGRWVDHGHHALIRVAAFRAIGGYDPTFSHNEDAEFDHRLRRAGFRIWLTGETSIDYVPRSSFGALLRQYYNFGQGRARNLRKHRARPATRQKLVAILGPALLLAVLAPLQPLLALPLVLWLAGCIAGGISIAWANGDGRRPVASLVSGLTSGLAAGLMHVAWSAGFWREVLRIPRGTAPLSGAASQ